MIVSYSLNALIAAGRKYSDAVSVAAEKREDVKREANSGQLTRLFFASLAAGEYDKARAALGADSPKDSPAREVWNRIKGRASESVFLFDYLSNGKGIPAGAGKAWKVAGAVTPAVVKAHIAAIAAPGEDDTGIATLIKAARARKAFLEETKELTERRDAATLAAFLRTQDGQKEFPGEDVESFRIVATAAEFSRAMEAGAVELKREESAAKSAADKAARTDQINTLASVVSGMSAAELDSLAALVAARRNALAPAGSTVEPANTTTPAARAALTKGVTG